MIEKIKGYFDINADDPLTIGVYPLGTGLNIERPYRHYWELKQFLMYLPKAKALHLVELGCGAGRWGFALAPYLQKYIGVDVSHAQIEHARNLAFSKNIPNIEFQEGDLKDFVSHDNREIDIFYASGVFQYVEDEEINNVLSEVKKKLGYEGLFIDRSTFHVGKSRLIRNDSNYYCIYRAKQELISLFEHNGFELVANDRSYVYLRNKKLFRKKWVLFWIEIGLKWIPNLTFAIMKKTSEMYEKIEKTKYIHEKIGVFSHEFMVFRLKK